MSSRKVRGRLARPVIRLVLSVVVVFLCGCVPIDGPATSAPQFVLPANGASVSSPVTLSVAGPGVSSATFSVAGATQFSDDVAPFEWTWDPAGAAPGTYELSITAVNDGVGTSRTTTVTVSSAGAPTITFDAPADGSTISSPTWLRASGSGVTSTQFYTDNVLRLDDTATPFEWSLDPAGVADGAHDIEIRALYVGGSESHFASVTTVRSGSSPMTPAQVVAAIAALRPGEWFEIPATKLRTVAPNPMPDGYFPYLVEAWSGGAYDTKRDRLVVWGGGHGDYAGNEVYAFDLKTFVWTRITDPSAYPSDDRFNKRHANVHPDGAPISRHTYDSIEYVPSRDAMLVAGGSTLWSEASWADPDSHLFDFAALRWSRSTACPVTSVAIVAAHDAQSGRVYAYGSGGATKFAYWDSTSGAWSTLSSAWVGWPNDGHGHSAEVDPDSRTFVMVGRDGTWTVPLASTGTGAQKLATTGSTAIESANYPGVGWDPTTKRIVAWHGGGTVYSLDVPSRVWTSRTTTVVNGSHPAAPSQGTHGRWRYCPLYKVFVVVNSVDGNVFAYRNS